MGKHCLGDQAIQGKCFYIEIKRPRYLEGANVLVEVNKYDVNIAPQLSLSKTKLLAVFKNYNLKFYNTFMT
jgi:hypothetical protein